MFRKADNLLSSTTYFKNVCVTLGQLLHFPVDLSRAMKLN